MLMCIFYIIITFTDHSLHNSKALEIDMVAILRGQKIVWSRGSCTSASPSTSVHLVTSGFHYSIEAHVEEPSLDCPHEVN